MHASPGFVPPPDLRAHLPMVGQGLLKMSCLSGVYDKDSFRVDSVIHPCFETCPRRHPKQQTSTRVRSGTSFEDRSVFSRGSSAPQAKLEYRNKYSNSPTNMTSNFIGWYYIRNAIGIVAR